MLNRTSRGLLLASAALPTMALAQQAEKPNILLIVVDDMGYSDMGCFGGEINTPNLDGMASEGVRFTQFFNCGRSCPSRGSLLTGCYPQTCGITGMGVSLSTDCVTVPEVLKTAGYRTAMSGKWHLSLTQGIGNNEDQMRWLSHQDSFGNRPFAPLETYPCNRGFDEHWGTIWGVVDHYDPFSLVHNEEPIFTDGIPDDFYSTDFITEKAIDFLDDFKQTEGEPFFLYVAYNAPHWPLHAKPEDIAKYRGRYDGGWDQMREDRYQRMVELGIVDPEETPVAPNASGRKWANETNKAFQAANMEVHAAMIDCVDQGVGRILNELRKNGQYENTIIIFTSDNGASSENYAIGSFDRHDRTRSGERVVHNSPTPGGQLSYNYLEPGWAGAVNAPFRYWKRESFHGGTATPTIIQWPAGMKAPKGSIVKDPCHYIDFMPTCLDLTGAEYPTIYKGHRIQPIAAEAQSLKPLLDGNHWTSERTIYWEHENGRAVREGDWRLTALTNGNWQLFNLKNDYSETTDLSAQYPEKVRHLKTLWNRWASSVGLAAPLTIEEGKSYTICNRNDNTLFVQDNGGDVLQMGAMNEKSYWTFVSTGQPDHYYVKNTTTGRYAQLCSTQTEVSITMGTEPVEYVVFEADAEGAGYYGFTTTNQPNTSFTAGCVGWNWRKDNTVQTYAAEAGVNHRSFWVLKEAVPVDNSDSWPLDGRYFTIKNNGLSANAYMHDNHNVDNLIECTSTVGDNAYWTFEKSDFDYHCYYVKNADTGRYIQAYNEASELDVVMGEEKAEYHVRNFIAENGGYGFASTDNVHYDFAAGTIGLNLRNNPGEPGCVVQTYPAVQGVNHRSFWYLKEVPGYTPSGIHSHRPAATSQKTYTPQGQPVSPSYRGLVIREGKKLIQQ